MNWIQQNKTLLWLIEAVGVLGIVIAVMLGRSMGGAEIEMCQLSAFTLPWIVSLAAGFPLLYCAWFAGPSPGPLFVFRKVTFWLLASFALAVFGLLYGVFVRKFW